MIFDCFRHTGTMVHRIPWHWWHLVRQLRSSMEYWMEVHGNLVSINVIIHGTLWHLIWRWQSSMEFHRTRWCFIRLPHSSMEFHGIFYGITLCLSHLKWRPLVPWKSMELLLYSIWRPQSSTNFHIKLQGSHVKPGVIWTNNQQVSWNSMGLEDIWLGNSRVPWNIEWKSKGSWCQQKWWF